MRTGLKILIALVLGYSLMVLSGCTANTSGPNRAPVAVAGPDQVVDADQSVLLDAIGSYDPDGDQPLTYRWRLIALPAASQLPWRVGTEQQVQFAPDVAGIYLVRLTVNDGDLDSIPDVIQVRVSGTPCSLDGECDDGQECTTDTCQEGRCENLPVTDGTECAAPVCSALSWDRQTCQAGACTGLEQILDCDDGNECTDDSCMEPTGCRNDNNTAACDDSDACTMDDSCSSGTCAGVALDGDGDGFVSDACGGNDCDDGNPNANPGLFEGPEGDATCSDGADNDCDGDLDAVDSGCFPCIVDDDCDDLNACNGQETCVTAACQPGMALACDDTNDCTNDSCDPASGCVNADRGDGVECGARSCSGLVWTRQVCLGAQCTDTAPERDCDDANVCTSDACDDGAGCTNPPADGLVCGSQFCSGSDLMTETCVAGACTGTAVAQACEDGLVCNGTESCSGTACQPGTDLTDGTLCDEGIGANGDECDSSCRGGSCDVGPPDCDDGLLCNGLETCVTGSGCQQGADATNGTACDEDAGADGNPCNSSCQVGACDPGSPAAQGQPCQDGFGCTTSDQCDVAGVCVGTPEDVRCPVGDTCWPACAPDATGCISPPGAMNLLCQDPVDLAVGVSDCSISLINGSIDNQTACLSCVAEVGVTTVDSTGFDGCGANGWQLEADSGNRCFDSAGNCTNALPTGPVDCCADFGSICDSTTFGQPVLVSDKEFNCGEGNDVEEWRLYKEFDFSDLTNITVCFDWATDATSNNEGLFVIADEVGGASRRERIFCRVAELAVTQDLEWQHDCVGLPAWAAGSSAVELIFALHSNDDGDIIYLDNIEVFGWGGGCTPDIVFAFDEDFSACDVSNWSIATGYLCGAGGAEWGCPDLEGIWLENGAFNLTATVDATELDSHVELCFDVAEENANDGEILMASVNISSGWQQLWTFEGDAGGNQVCRTICVDLSQVDPAVHNHPGFGLLFEGWSDNDNREVFLDNVTVTGVRHCTNSLGAISLSSPPVEQGGGVYDFTVTDVSGTQLTAGVECFWDPAAANVNAEDFIWFRP